MSNANKLARDKKYREKKRRDGKCATCSNKLPINYAYKLCIRCRERNKKYRQLNREHIKKIEHNWYETHKEKLIAASNKWKKSHPDWYKKYYWKHKDMLNKKQRIRYREREAEVNKRLRLEVLSHYSGGTPHCRVCKITNPQYLAIDHINNDGYIQKKQGVYGIVLYRWLKRNNFPEGYQILCHNHNYAKHRHTQTWDEPYVYLVD